MGETTPKPATEVDDNTSLHHQCASAAAPSCSHTADAATRRRAVAADDTRSAYCGDTRRWESVGALTPSVGPVAQSPG